MYNKLSQVVTTVMSKMKTAKEKKSSIPRVGSLESDQSEAFDILFKKEAHQDLGHLMYGDIKT